MVRVIYVNINIGKMPFKTKKQKLKALQRRYTISAALPVNYQSLKVSKKIQDSQEKVPEIIDWDPVSNQAVGSIESDYRYVKTDLLKIAIVAGVISIFQVLVFLYKDLLSILFPR